MPWFLFNSFPQVWKHLVVFTILFCNVSPCIKKVMYHQTESITTVTCLVSDQYNQQSIIELLKGKFDTLPIAEINPCQYNLGSIYTISTINWSLLNFWSMIGRKKTTHTPTHLIFWKIENCMLLLEIRQTRSFAEMLFHLKRLNKVSV